jgi:DNA-binding CsgD family transcriptional regulator
VIRGHAAQVLALRPLDAGEAARLAAATLGALPGPALRDELRRAGGNPAYLRDLVTGLDQAGLIERAKDTAEFTGAPGATPPQLAMSVGRRLRFLGEQSRAVIRVAAVVSGSGVTAADLAAVTGRTETLITAAVTEATEAGILTRADAGADASPRYDQAAQPFGPLAPQPDTRLAFQHELVRQALAAEVPAAVSPVLHAQTARALATAGRSLEDVARHMLDGPLVMEDWALRWLSTRSETSVYEVPRSAIDLLESAIASLDDNDPRWEAFASRLAQARFWLGEDDGAFRMALEVARRSEDADVACRMRIFAMRSALRSGRYADGIAVGEAALAEETADAWRARLGSWLAVLLLLSGQPMRGDKLAAEALRLAASSDSPLAKATVHHAAAFGTGAASALAHAEQALRALDGAGTTEQAGAADLRLSLAKTRLTGLARVGDDEELDAALQDALREAAHVAAFDAATIWGVAAQIRYRQGLWDEALEYLNRIDPAFRSHPEVIKWRGLEALISLHRGQRAAAAVALAALKQPTDDPFCLTASALAAEANGDPGEALQPVTAWLDNPAAWHGDAVYDDAPDLVRLALAAAEPEVAEQLTAALEANAEDDPVPDRTLAARCARAQLTDDAPELQAVAGDYGTQGWPLRQGMALEEAAVRLAKGASQDAVQAARVLAEAADCYRAVGADWDIRRADARLRELGVRRGARVAHRTARTGWASLTPAEQQVADLVADGLQNAEIAAVLQITERTVRAHLSNALAKLQLTSRAQLAAAKSAAPAP